MSVFSSAIEKLQSHSLLHDQQQRDYAFFPLHEKLELLILAYSPKNVTLMTKNLSKQIMYDSLLCVQQYELSNIEIKNIAKLLGNVCYHYHHNNNNNETCTKEEKWNEVFQILVQFSHSSLNMLFSCAANEMLVDLQFKSYNDLINEHPKLIITRTEVEPQKHFEKNKTILKNYLKLLLYFISNEVNFPVNVPFHLIFSLLKRLLRTNSLVFSEKNNSEYKDFEILTKSIAYVHILGIKLLVALLRIYGEDLIMLSNEILEIVLRLKRVYYESSLYPLTVKFEVIFFMLIKESILCLDSGFIKNIHLFLFETIEKNTQALLKSNDVPLESSKLENFDELMHKYEKKRKHDRYEAKEIPLSSEMNEIFQKLPTFLDTLSVLVKRFPMFEPLAWDLLHRTTLVLLEGLMANVSSIQPNIKIPIQWPASCKVALLEAVFSIIYSHLGFSSRYLSIFMHILNHLQFDPDKKVKEACQNIYNKVNLIIHPRRPICISRLFERNLDTERNPLLTYRNYNIESLVNTPLNELQAPLKHPDIQHDVANSFKSSTTEAARLEKYQFIENTETEINNIKKKAIINECIGIQNKTEPLFSTYEADENDDLGIVMDDPDE